MKKNLVGILIRKGETTVQIQERIKDFPTNPTIEYFTHLGYSENTAKIYKNQLKKNDLKNQEEEQKEAEEYFIYSENANKNNLIFDTCALQNRETIQLIEKSDKVTVLLSTLNEMEELKRKRRDSDGGREVFLQTQIRIYAKKFLKETEKYRLVPYIGDSYNDNSILKYLMEQPINERQTIITADTLLATRAKCLGLDYILYNKSEYFQEPRKQEMIKEKIPKSKRRKDTVEKTKKVSYYLGVKVECLENKITVNKFNNFAEVYYVKNQNCVKITERNTEIIKDIDYIVVIMRVKQERCVKALKLIVKDQELKKEEQEFRCINEIYKLEGKIHSEILDDCKNIL